MKYKKKIYSILLILFFFVHLNEYHSLKCPILPNIPNNKNNLIYVYDNFIPTNLIDLIKNECIQISNWSHGIIKRPPGYDSTKKNNKNSELIHGKKATFWYETLKYVKKPRFYIEKIIKLLKRTANQHIKLFYNNFCNNIEKEKCDCELPKIHGAEWWIQFTPPGQDISFHYDKDEGFASLHSKMRMPLLGTITYLSDDLTGSSPTLILNQTTIDGNNDIPIIAEDAHLIYPKIGRHVIFRGNLNHGVVGDLSFKKLSNKLSQNYDEKPRLTLLINWWGIKPIPPNTIELTNDILDNEIYPLRKTNDELLPSIFWDDLGNSLLNKEKLMNEPINLNILNKKNILSEISFDNNDNNNININNNNNNELIFNENDLNMYTVELPPRDGYHFYLPSNYLINQINTNQSNHFKIHWDYNHVYGNVGIFDINHRTQINSIFHMKIPKSFIMVNNDNELNELRNIILPLSKEYLYDIKVYTGYKDKSEDLINQFNLNLQSKYPEILFHNTEKDQKYVMNLNGKKLTKEKLKSFWDDCLNNNIKPIS